MHGASNALAGCAVVYSLLAGGCGEPLLSSSAYDSPLFSLHGHLNLVPIDADALRVAVVWVDPEQLQDDVPNPGHTTRFELSGARFELSFYSPPPPASILRLANPTTGGLLASVAVGELVAVDDVDGNGNFAVAPIEDGSEILPPDLYRGTQSRFLVSFVEEQLVDPKDELPELQGLMTGTPGYHVVLVDCTTPATPFTHSVTRPDALDIDMTILDVGSTQLPFLRSCLRTHPIEPHRSPPP
jgi:hypothetical protein